MSSPPPPPEGILASDRERDGTVELLSSALSDGRLGLEDFTDRLEVALSARTTTELAGLTGDLHRPAAGPAPSPIKRPSWVVAIMSSTVRRGRWRLGADTRSVALMGECTLDLRQAEVHASTSHITAAAIMGEVRIIIPEGVEVEVDGVAIMGSKDVRSSHQPPLPGAPVIHVTAIAIMGEVHIETRSSHHLQEETPGGDDRMGRLEARHQRHLERRELRRSRRDS